MKTTSGSATLWLRRSVLIAGALLFVTQSLYAQQKQCSIPAVEKTIEQVSETWKAGYNEGNPDKVAALYDENATYLTQHFVTGIVHGRAAIRAYVKKGTDAGYKIDSIKVLGSDCSPDFAYALTRYDSTNGGQKVFGVNIVVLKKIGGRWLIVAHESAVPDEKSAIQSLDISTAN